MRQLLRRGIVHGEVAAGVGHGEELRRRVARALLALSGVRGGPDRRREPDPSLVIEHRIVHVVLAGPDHLVGPVRRRLRHRRAGRRRVRVADGQRHLARGVGDRIQHRHVVGAQFERAVNRPVGIDARIPPVGRHDVVQVGLGIGPVPLRDDHVPLDPLRPCGAGGSCTRTDPIGPIREHLQHARAAEIIERVAHLTARLSGLHAAIPRGDGVGERTERRRDFPRGLGAERMARGAAARFHAADPIALALHVRRDAVAAVAGAWEFALGRHLHQRQPVRGRDSTAPPPPESSPARRVRFRFLPGVVWVFGESTSPYPRTQTL